MPEPIVFPKGSNYEWQQVTHSGRTKFQDDTVRTIVTSDEFDFACTDFELPAESTYSGPFNFLLLDPSEEDRRNGTKHECLVELGHDGDHRCPCGERHAPKQIH
jgi:hypothetical protein